MSISSQSVRPMSACLIFCFFLLYHMFFPFIWLLFLLCHRVCLATVIVILSFWVLPFLFCLFLCLRACLTTVMFLSVFFLLFCVLLCFCLDSFAFKFSLASVSPSVSSNSDVFVCLFLLLTFCFLLSFYPFVFLPLFFCFQVSFGFCVCERV